jgi:hypothetical protein
MKHVSSKCRVVEFNNLFRANTGNIGLEYFFNSS